MTNYIHPQGFGTRYSSTPRQLYQLYSLQRTYQTVAEEFEYKETDDHPLEDFPDVGYAEEEPDGRNIFYITEEPDELFVNFLGVELICHRCKSSFLSQSLIHKHLKSNCIGWNQENNTAQPLVPMLPLVIKSTTSIKAVRSGYAFRGWNYATDIVCLTLGEIPLHTDVTSLCCLDTGFGVTPVDRA